MIGYATFEELESWTVHTLKGFEDDSGEALKQIMKAQWLPPQAKKLVLKALESPAGSGAFK